MYKDRLELHVYIHSYRGVARSRAGGGGARNFFFSRQILGCGLKKKVLTQNPGGRVRGVDSSKGPPLLKFWTTCRSHLSGA